MTQDEVLEGELTAPPRSVYATVLLAVTGVLLGIHLVRLFARFALAYRRPAELRVLDTGVRIHARTLLLGRTLRDADLFLTRRGLARVEREVRYPRIGLYVGLVALAAGSYFGVSTLVDGVRSASPSLLLSGLLLAGAGVALDFVFGSL